jgi:hypothetical protein
MSKGAGIDKIALHSFDFSIKDLTNRDVWGFNANYRQGAGGLPIYSDTKGNRLEANKIYHQSTKTGAIYDVNQMGLLVHFNPSKAHHEYNLLSTGDELNRYVKAIQDEAKQLLNVNLLDANLVRLDLAKNRAMEQPISTYHNAFRLIKGKRSDTKEQPDGIYIGNKSQETTFYNKKEELAHRFIQTLTPDNFLRGEIRLKKKDSVSRYAGADTLGALLSTKPKAIEENYNSFLTKNIFSRANIGQQIRIDFKEEMQFFRELKEQRPKAYFRTWLTIQSIDNILREFGSIENLAKFFELAGEHRMNINRNVRYIKEMIAIKGSVDISRNKLTDVALLEELKLKFVA